MDYFYGTDLIKVNITEQVKKLTLNNVIIIPPSDIERSEIFGDPVPGILKKIYINDLVIEHYIKIVISNGIISQFVPIVIISFNNWVYVQNTIKQLKNPYFDIIIMDNKSTDPDTINFLLNVQSVQGIKVIWNDSNNGPWITPDNNLHIWNILPNQFILTDPDLQFNENLPYYFIETLLEISNLHNAYKVGFALDISDFDKMHQISDYHFGQSIYQWEHSQHWTKRLEHPKFELYLAPIDTTFCLISKNKNPCNKIRIAGNFIAKHIPWYTSNPLYNIYSNYQSNKISTKISNMSSIIVNDINNKYSKITKNDQIFFIPKNDPSINFWENAYNNWEPETFKIFDNYLSPDKIFIDIGAWIGTTCMYSSRKSKEVYSVEADPISITYFQQNCINNCNGNVKIIDKVLYSESNKLINFGINTFLNGKLNDSTSQINDTGELIQTISFNDLVKDLNGLDISLIKVDIEGGEENILNDLFAFHDLYDTPMYISFHVDWWNNKDLTRFKGLEKYVSKIKENPFISIFFYKNKLKFEYGTDSNSIDVTDQVYKYCFKNGIITIPANDEIRAQILTDPLPSVLKWIYIHHPDGTVEKYSDSVIIRIINGIIETEVIIKPVIVAIAKFEQDYIIEWVNYHLSLGFEKIYLYDNEDTPVYKKILNNPKVHVIHLPGNNYSKPVQYFALEHFIQNILPNKNITHVLHIDIDEFISFKKHTLKNFIKEYIIGNCAGIGINWRHFGDSGNTIKSLEPVTQRFTYCESKGNQTIKTIFNKDHFNGWRICHCISPKENYVIKSTNGEIIPESYSNPDYSIVQINHYKCKTRNEFKYARSRGRCDIHDTYIKTDNDSFDLFNFNEIHDLTARNYYYKITHSLNEILMNVDVVEGNINNIPEQALDLMNLGVNAKNILEIGFNAGHSAELFLKMGANVTSFDLGEHSYLSTSKDYLDTIYPGKHTLILGDSTITIPEYSFEYFDLIFIDGGHTFEIAKQDLENCMRFAHPCTIVVMDDITFKSSASWTFGPSKAWSECKLITQINSKEYSPGRGMCWGKYLL